MTDEEFRSDLLASAAARAETHSTGSRDAFVEEVLERLWAAGEVPDAEPCAETLIGQRGRRLELDAFAFDEADSSLHLFVAIRDGGDGMPAAITLTEAREQGFGRLLGFFEQARDGWLVRNVEEARPLWDLARRIEAGGKPAALRLSVLTDRPVSERLREIPGDQTREGIPVTFQIWDVTRLKRIHDAQSVRDDLFVDLSMLPGGGLVVLPATAGSSDYVAYLAVIPGEVLADIYIRHGSRLLEGNVRTFLGRRGTINRGIAVTLANNPDRFFAYNNGIATTASAVNMISGPGGTQVLTGVTDLQIVNGGQTTASLASLRRDGKLPASSVFVPMKLSVVAPEVAADVIPLISRYANSQNTVRASDFFANGPFHRRMEEISRRILAPAVGHSQIQTHWYYERARGQYLNDQVGMTASRQAQFQRVNPRTQVITKTDMAKVENCFDQLPDLTSRGAEKSFTGFAERVTKEWEDERKRASYGDDWFRSSVARILLFRATERLVSEAAWYERGYRAQVVAYTTARIARLAEEEADGGRLDYLKVWAMQEVEGLLQAQLLSIAEAMMKVLRSPPQAGQNVTEWAKQQACRKVALETVVPVMPAFHTYVMGKTEVRSADRGQRGIQRVTDGLAAVQDVLAFGADGWRQVRSYARERGLMTIDDERALDIVCSVPRYVPSDTQARRALAILDRCHTAGMKTDRTAPPDASVSTA